MRAYPASLLAVIPLLAASAAAQISGDVSGTWSTGSVVDVIGDLRVPIGQTLTIQPGVLVRFGGPYQLRVEGRLVAVGDPDDEILMTRAQPTEASKWRGIRFVAAAAGSVLEHCHVEFAKRDGPYPDVRGGAVWIADCSPPIRYCTFNDNFSGNGSFNGTGAAVTVERNSTSVVEFNHCHDNTADSGGAILVGGTADPVIRGNVIENNTGRYAGGGIYVSAGAQATIEGNLIRGNTAGGWGGGGINLWSATIYYGTFSHVYDNTIVGNVAIGAGPAQGGGGIYSRYDTSVLVNNTLSGNRAAVGGGLYVITFSNLPPQLRNNVLWGDSATSGPEIALEASTGSRAVVDHCDVQGGWPGTANLTADPLFVDAAGGDYHLRYDSPCRDAGSNALVPAFPSDFEGDPRIAGGTADIGADEFHTHLYHVGTPTPGGSFAVQLIGGPGSPALWAASTCVQSPPLSIPGLSGALQLCPAGLVAVPVGVVGATGTLGFTVAVPASAPPVDVPTQAVVGAELSNLSVLSVR